MIVGCLAYITAVICLYIQANGLMSNLKTKNFNIYIVVLLYLIASSVIALAANLVFIGLQTSDLLGHHPNYPFATVQDIALITYAISLGSWCLVSLISVVKLIISRYRVVVTNHLYDSAIQLLCLTLLESFIVPCTLDLFEMSKLTNTLSDLLHPSGPPHRPRHRTAREDRPALHSNSLAHGLVVCESQYSRLPH